jgi:hypothetical protein
VKVYFKKPLSKHESNVINIFVIFLKGCFFPRRFKTPNFKPLYFPPEKFSTPGNKFKGRGSSILQKGVGVGRGEGKGGERPRKMEFSIRAPTPSTLSP